MRTKLFSVMLVALIAIGVFAPVAAQGSLVIWADDTRAPILEELGAAFEAEFGVPVVVQELGFGDIRDNFKTAGPAGEGPDIIIGAHDWLGELVVNGLLAPIDLGDMEESFLPAAVQAFVYEGELYGVPYATENVAFVYNPELVETPPATWDEVKTVSEQLVADGVSQYGFVRQDNDPYHFFPIQTAFGGYVFGVTEEGYDATDIGIDSEGSIAAATWYESMVAAGLQPTGVDYDVMHTLFEGGDAAMIVTGPWALPRIKESGVPYAVAAIPEGPAGVASPFLGVQGFMISAFSQNPILAEAFLLDFVATDEAMTAIFEADPRPPAFLSVREAVEDVDLQGFIAAGEEGLAMPAIPQMSSVWTAWTDALTLINTGQLGAEEAFTTAGEQIRTLLGSGS